MRPSLVRADEQAAAPGEVFRPVDASLLPEVADILDRLAVDDPDVLAAVEDVDRTLIWETFHEPPARRLARSAQQARLYARWKAGA